MAVVVSGELPLLLALLFSKKFHIIPAKMKQNDEKDLYNYSNVIVSSKKELINGLVNHKLSKFNAALTKEVMAFSTLFINLIP